MLVRTQTVIRIKRYRYGRTAFAYLEPTYVNECEYGYMSDRQIRWTDTQTEKHTDTDRHKNKDTHTQT